ncbi:MAG: hypothetical protein R3F41_06550 [Gammaproteobacteria bacterium]|nr:hypothetical protein [Pseudomonadales bacterium]
MTLANLAAIAEIIGIFTLATGLFFGIFQLRANREQQRNAVATSLAQSFYDKEFSKAIVLLQNFPDGVSAVTINAAGQEYVEAAVKICTSFETMGLLVFRKIAPLDLVMDLAGGVCASMYRKLQNWIHFKRETQHQPSWAEWFEWLATLSEQHKNESIPIQTRAANWRS